MNPGRTLIALLLAAAVAAPGAAVAQEAGAKAKNEGASDDEPGTVLTFYGLLKLEQDPDVSDERKLKEWRAFIERAQQQIEYAEKAVNRWKNAAKIRLVEAAQEADQDPALSAAAKIDKWREVEKLYPRSKEGRRAKKRVAHWRRVETKRLTEAAEEVERARRPKVERIAAWAQVLAWVERGSEARAAQRRITELQTQLFREAMSVDAIARVDKQTKLEAWRDVLKGRPTPAQKKKAQQRVRALEAELGESQARID